MNKRRPGQNIETNSHTMMNKRILYGIMTKELVVCEVRINSDSRMTSFEVIMPLKLQLTMKAFL